MRIAFAGTTDFSLTSLKSLIGLCHQSDDYELVGIYTQPDREKGRGRTLQANAIKQCAEMHRLPLYQPVSFKEEAVQKTFKALRLDLMVVVAYGLLLPSRVLATPQFGCINVHASLLPKWRGAAPIQRALLSGDKKTGVTIMQMDTGLDTGDILDLAKVPITDIDTAKSLETKLALVGANTLLTTLQTLSEKQKAKKTQPLEDVSYASKLTKEEGMINWSLSAVEIERKIRAFNPWPISFSWVQGERLRIWQAFVKSSEPFKGALVGEIITIDRKGIQVATGQGIIQLTYVQREGGRYLPVADLLNGPLAYLKPGMYFQNK